MTVVEEIRNRALALGVNERALLAESLLTSLPPLPEEWSEAEDLAEAERRDSEIENGQVQDLHDGEFWKQVEARRRNEVAWGALAEQRYSEYKAGNLVAVDGPTAIQELRRRYQ